MFPGQHRPRSPAGSHRGATDSGEGVTVFQTCFLVASASSSSALVFTFILVRSAAAATPSVILFSFFFI